jgi:hypothetical protein
VGADVSRAQSLVLGQQVGVPRQNRDLRRGSALQRIGHGRRVRWRHRDTVDFLGDEIGYDLRLFVAAAMLARSDVQALDGALEFGFRFLASDKRLIEDGVVGVLRHEREGVGISSLRRSRDREQRPGGDRAGQQYFQHSFSSQF